LPTLRSDGRAGVARWHPGDAGGPVGGEKGMNRSKLLVVGAAALFLSVSPTVHPSGALPACDPGAGLTLPDGFCAVVVADQVGAPSTSLWPRTATCSSRSPAGGPARGA